ncbi:MAG: class I SAM-dependent methyltransferase [Myxococcales bacterium]|nr:class I SAM-dependent methyltransferase [Myxococcales bacterium]
MFISRTLFLGLLGWAFLAMGASHESCAKPKKTKPQKTKSINARFLNKKLDVKRWKKTFSSHGREVFRHRHEIVKRLGLRPGMSVADVGAGTGAFLPVLRKLILPGGKLYLVDISPAFIKMLRARVQKEKLKDVMVIQNTERVTKLPKASVDLVFTSDTYHHFEYVKETLASIHQALRPGGRFVVVDFERIPGKTRPWLLEHVKHGKEHVIREVQTHGFVLLREEKVSQLKENYVLVFQRR